MNSTARRDVAKRIALLLLPLVASCTDQANKIDSPLAPSASNNPAASIASPEFSVAAVRVYHNPYRNLKWAQYKTIKGQHHDHSGVNYTQIAAYDAAGYGAVSLMQYSGVASMPTALTYRLWTPQNFFTTAQLASFRNIKVFIPNAEEVGLLHMTSSFMTTYIAKWEPAYYPTKQPWHYETMAELVGNIIRYGGAPVLAHPVAAWSSYSAVTGYIGMEVYDALYVEKYRQGGSAVDLNTVMVANWDSALIRNQRIWGLGVNDHYGPGQPLSATVPADVRDSGKILAFVPTISATDYEAAFRNGVFVAIKDMGVTKDRYPDMKGIVVSDTAVVLKTTAYTSARWVANGKQVAQGLVLDLRTLSTDTKYVRAEIANAEGSVVYIQPLVIRRSGDADGNGIVDSADTTVCTAVKAGTDHDPDHVDACLRTK
jgi:hypothetical protein